MDVFRLLFTGFDKGSIPEEICGLFYEYGMTDIQISLKHVFVEFDTK